MKALHDVLTRAVGYDGYMSKPLVVVLAIIVLISAGLIFWFVHSHSAPAGPAPAATSTAPAQASVKQHLTDKGQYYEADAAYPSTTALAASAGASADAAAVASMKAFEADQIAQFKKDAGLDALTPEDIQVQGLSADRQYALQIDYKVYSSPATLSYVYLIYEDTLGAHPNTYYRTFTFDKKTGAELGLQDIFASADYLSVLSNESRNRLPALLKARTSYDPDPDMLAAGTTADAANFQSFYLDGADFVIIFPPYQVAAYAAGTTELRIARSALGNTLKAELR